MDGQGEGRQRNGVAASLPGKTLSEHWLLDQSLGFAATLLGNFDGYFPYLPRACMTLLLDHRQTIETGPVSDSTLLLIHEINRCYFDKDHEDKRKSVDDFFAEKAEQLEALWLLVRKKLEHRGLIILHAELEKTPAEPVTSDDQLNRLLISHLVHLLKQPHITITKLIKWLRRATKGNVQSLRPVIKKLGLDSELRMTIQRELNASRDPNIPIHERLDQIDTLHHLVLQASGLPNSFGSLWWTRICMAYRSSLFCWPLLIEEGTTGRGVSLPFLLALDEGSESIWPPASRTHCLENNGQKVSFQYAVAQENGGKKEHALGLCDLCKDRPTRMEGVRFGFTLEWGNAFAVGMYAAKQVWSDQNRHSQHDNGQADEDRKRTASLNVDLNAACAIVNSVYSKVEPESAWFGVDEKYRWFTLGDRSAEAYWAQCVLGLLLPAREVPLGLCTGTIREEQGEFLIQPVAGIRAKLDYADRAGVPRMVIPGKRDDYIEYQENVDDNAFRDEVREFLHAYGSEDTPKTLEFNFARTIRAAANAMQPSGWNRANFLRTPGFRRGVIDIQKRLSRVGTLSGNENDCMHRIDDVMLNNRNASDAIHHVNGNELLLSHSRSLGFPVEELLGKWAAWKDHQIRTQTHRQGFSVLALRTAEGDSDIRLWAALAEMLGASEHWWNRFKCADLSKAADLLAQLLCNMDTDPEISSGSPPDLLIIFDDEGLVQKRDNTTSLKHFRHQFNALLNPPHTGDREPYYLDEKLKKCGDDIFYHQIRIIVVSNMEEEPQEVSAESESLPQDDDFEFLKRMAIFRFGCSRQAGFAMVNFDRNPDNRIKWNDFEISVRRFLERGWLTGRQNVLQVTAKARRLLPADEQAQGGSKAGGDEWWWWLAKAHRYAALALCPILHPPGFRISTGRDRQLEPGNVLEADWHLKRANSLVPKRFHSRWKVMNDGLPRPDNSQALLISLRAWSDWDTVYRMRVNPMTCMDSIELCDELLQTRREQTGREPPLMMIGWALESKAMAIKKAAKNELDSSEEEQIEELVEMAENAIEHMPKGLNDLEREQQKLFVYSRLIEALRALDVPLNDSRLKDAKECLEAAVIKMVDRGFLLEGIQENENFDDFPISKECWRALWSDGKGSMCKKTVNKAQALKERSTYAYAATRMNLKRSLTAKSPGPLWEEPWVMYFALTHPDTIETAQIIEPLRMWWNLYGNKEESNNFGKRVLDMRPHIEFGKKQKVEGTWSRDIVQACENLWGYISYTDSTRRLDGWPVICALRLINVFALQETLLAFNFLNGCARNWIENWASVIGKPKANWPYPASEDFWYRDVCTAWREFSCAVVRHRAGWVTMLSGIESLPSDKARLKHVKDWLKALDIALEGNNNIPDKTNNRLLLWHADPEKLLHTATRLKSVSDYNKSLETAIKSGRNILKMKNEKGWTIFGHNGRHRILLTRILRELSLGVSKNYRASKQREDTSPPP